MKYWVTGLYFKVDTHILDGMKEFAMSIKRPEPMKRLAMELFSATAERVWFLVLLMSDPCLTVACHSCNQSLHQDCLA
jgi:hypothetical protein